MSTKEKNFNTKLYGIITFVAIAAVLVVICIATFSARYTAFHPEEVAKTYVDTIIQTGDGYNAYKNTIASYDSKYGDYIRKYYIYPAVYRDTDYKPGDNTDDFVGYNDESYMSDTTVNDDGTLKGKVIDAMYPYYEQLIESYGWDDYDSIYTKYIEKLIEVRQSVFGDKYLSDDVFFTAFESNVSTYGDKLTGTEDVFDENTGVQLNFESTGIYEAVYGENYRLVAVTDEQVDIDIEQYKTECDTTVFETYGVSIDDISEVKSITVYVKAAETTLATIKVVVVKIGMSWYVDNTATNTGVLYTFYK